MRLLRLAPLIALLALVLGAGTAHAAAPLVADNGFRPTTDGYSFENYGNEERYRNLTVVEMRRLFGDAVCVPGTSGTACRLSPVARQWMESANEAMAGGHCMGFAVTSQLFHRRVGDPFGPAAFGASASGPPSAYGATSSSRCAGSTCTLRSLGLARPSTPGGRRNLSGIDESVPPPAAREQPGSRPRHLD